MSSKSDNSGLTPLKIPGKRYRKPAVGDEPNKRRNLGGRPRKEVKKKPKSVVRKAIVEPKNLENMKSQPQMSSFEKLPTEVLENIFLQSLNFNLPRSSPVLAGRLSSNHTYIQTIMNVFDESWMLRFTDGDGGWRKAADMDEAAQRQTDLLKLRWVTLPLLRESRKRWLSKNFKSLKPEDIASRYKDHKVHFLRNHPEYEDSTNWPETLEATLDLDEYLFSSAYSFAVKGARPFDDRGEPQLCRAMWVREMLCPDLAYTTLPPQHILKGPWTEDKLLHLFWHAWAGLNLEHGSTILPEVASHGLQDAIQEGSLQAIAFLQLLGISHFSHEDIFEALATTTASNRAILIVRVLDLFFCGCYKSSPKGNWEYWVEDIVTLYGREQKSSERNELMKELRREVYDYARTAYSNVVEFRETDDGHSEELAMILSRSTHITGS